MIELVTELKKEQAYTELTLHRARLGAAPPSRRPQYQQKDYMIQRQKELFQAGALTVKEYITAMRRVTHGHCYTRIVLFDAMIYL